MFDIYFSADMKDIRMTAFITDFIRMFKRHSLIVPSELTILAKALSILEGVFQDISPDMNLIQTAKGYLGENLSWENILQRFSKEKLTLKSYTFMKDAVELPGNMVKLLKQTLNGRTRLKIDMNHLDEKWIDVKKMFNRVVMSLIIVGLLLSSAIMSSSPGGRYLGQAGFIVSGLFGIWLLISIHRSGNL